MFDFHVINGKYTIVRLLERLFDVITYRHNPREDNAVVDSLENYILD